MDILLYMVTPDKTSEGAAAAPVRQLAIVSQLINKGQNVIGATTRIQLPSCRNPPTHLRASL